MNLQTRLKVARPLLIALLLAAFLRAWAVSLLPQDFDEPVYLQNAFDYASLIKSGNLNGVIDYSQTTEHPALVKLLYAGGILLLGKNAGWINAFYLSRSISAVFGVLAVAFLAVAVDPFAAGLLAVHTLAIKYTSQVYLEAVPAAMSIAAILAFLRIKREAPTRWLVMSAAALGMTAASKYTYLPVAIVVLAYLAIFEKRLSLQWLVIYSAMALGVFFALDVSLWHDPLTRLVQSLSFHVQYSQGTHVQEVGYPWYQPFIWIFTSAPAGWHPNVFFYFGFDGPIAVLAVLGLWREWQERRWLVVWFVSGLAFLLLWPTKWPQYALTLTPALCIMGAESLRRGWKWLQGQETYWDYFKNLLPAPGRWFWASVGVFTLFIAVIYLSAAARLAVGKIGWSHLTTQNTFLPSNSINDLLPMQDGSMLIATDKGAVLYGKPLSTDQSGTWVLFSQKNSGLSNSDVLSLTRDAAGELWFGTAAGVSRYDGETWSVYRASDLGLTNDEILSLASDDKGDVVAGTQTGASYWNGKYWTPLTNITGEWPVFALTASRGDFWLGTADGVWQVNIPRGQIKVFLSTSAIKHITIASDGTVWAATSGSGLAKLVNGAWQYYTTANSDLPLNLVNWVDEVQPGKFWIATSYAGEVGGEPVAFDGQKWFSFTTDNSGSSGAEPLVIAHSSDDQVWIGTASRGIDLYKRGR